MTSELFRLGAASAVRLILKREVDPVEFVGACLDRIDRLEPMLNAWVHLDRSSALRQASSVQAKLMSGAELGELAGVPVGVKDIFNTRDMPTQMGSPIWSGFEPGNDARVVFYLRMADAVIPGKTVTAEFAVHTPGPTRNPHNTEHTPGTSSSGSAVAVATGMVPVALGTQTAGSIIRPASYCGILGFKPSFGLVPRTGMLKTTDTLDTVGTFARNIDDVRVLFEVIRVHGRDFPIAEAALADPARRSKPQGRPWRVAIVRGPRWQDAEDYARDSLMRFASRIGRDPDVDLTEVDLPELSAAHDVHARIYDRTLAYYFKEEFRRHTLVSPIMRDIITRGNGLTLENYVAALEAQRSIAQVLDSALSDRYDVLLSLSTGGEARRGLDSVDRPDNCLIWTLAGLPTITLPAFRGPLGLPFGLQAVARRYSDYLLLQFAEFLCEAFDIPLGAELIVSPEAVVPVAPGA